jgi:hypothetical protein
MKEVIKYPQNPVEWQSAIHDSIGISLPEGQRTYEAKTFPYNPFPSFFPSCTIFPNIF